MRLNLTNSIATHPTAKKAFFNETSVFPKLTVNQPNDRYEQEADAMADQVMKMDAGQVQAKPMVSQIQRKCDACEEEEAQRMPLMRQAESGGGMEVSTGFSQKLEQSRGAGNALPGATQQRMGQAFGTDFSHVRVHTGSRAAEMSQGIQAKAFTHGSDIYFNQGQYQPGSSGGDHLLAHELTHVVQQGGTKGGIQRSLLGGLLGGGIGALVGAGAGAGAGYGIGEAISEGGGGLGALIGGIAGGVLFGVGGALLGHFLSEREKIEDCDPDQTTLINSALPIASRKLDAALEILNQSPVSTFLRDALWLMFRSSTDETLELVRSRITGIRGRFAEMQFNCTNEEQTNSCEHFSAYVSGHSNPVYLCTNKMSEYTPESYAELIIHEAGHLFFESVVDHGYFSSPSCGETMESDLDADSTDPTPPQSSVTEGDPPAQRLENSDSYSCLVHLLTDSRLSAENEEDRQAYQEEVGENAASYRGERLSITRDEEFLEIGSGEVINLYPEIFYRMEFLFELDNLPRASGFSFQWTLFKGSGEENPVPFNSTESRLDLTEEGDVLDNLRTENVQEGTLRCAVVLYRDGGEAQTINVDRHYSFDHRNRPEES